MKRDDVIVDIFLLCVRVVGWSLFIAGALAWKVLSMIVRACATRPTGTAWWQQRETDQFEEWVSK